MLTRYRFLSSLVVCLTILNAGSVILHADDDASWKAATARIKITPEQPMCMAGYASRDRPAEGTLTDLWAKALVLEDRADNRPVLVTLDLIASRRVLAEGGYEGASAMVYYGLPASWVPESKDLIIQEVHRQIER